MIAEPLARKLDPGAPRLLHLALAALVLWLLAHQLRSVFTPIVGEHAWRQADTYAVAYNFVHTSADFFHPRIDWTYGRTGIMGMEAPVYPYLAAGLMALLGDDRAWVARLVTWVLFAAAALAAAITLAPDRGPRASFALGWLAFLALSPMALFELRQIQPDPAMMSLSLLAACAFRRHAATSRARHLVLGLVLYTLAVLTKLPALSVAPAMWLLAGGRHKPVRTAALLSIPIALGLAWEAWADHLTARYDDGHAYFATGFTWHAVLRDLTSAGQLAHVFGFLVPRYAANVLLWPLAIAGAAASVQRRHRTVALPMAVWLAGAALFAAAFSSRLGSHWYYALLMLPPLAYFGGTGIATLLELAAERKAVAAALLAAGLLVIPRAASDALGVLSTRAREAEWRGFDAEWGELRRALDRISTREDVFVVDGASPWYLHLALRRGFVHRAVDIDQVGWDYFRGHRARFFVHFQQGGPRPALAATLPLIARGPRWEVYCLERGGCPRRAAETAFARREGPARDRAEDGRVVVIGGGSALAEVHDPATGAWTAGGTGSADRAGHTATVLASCAVWVAGGASSDLYDPWSATFAAGPALGGARTAHTATRLLDGRVLLAGGLTATITASAGIYDVTTALALAARSRRRGVSAR